MSVTARWAAPGRPPIVVAPALAAPTGSVAYAWAGVGFVWDYRDWRSSRYGRRQWGAAVKPDPAARVVTARQLGFGSARDALTWLANSPAPAGSLQ